MGDATIYRMLNKKTIVHLSVFSLHLLHVFPQGIETIASSVDGKDGGYVRINSELKMSCFEHIARHYATT
jgi:hypothetical protein